MIMQANVNLENQTQRVRCPNCGEVAQRYCVYHSPLTSSPHPAHFVCHTECQACDYLMAVCISGADLTDVYSTSIPTFSTES